MTTCNICGGYFPELTTNQKNLCTCSTSAWLPTHIELVNPLAPPTPQPATPPPLTPKDSLSVEVEEIRKGLIEEDDRIILDENTEGHVHRLFSIIEELKEDLTKFKGSRFIAIMERNALEAELATAQKRIECLEEMNAVLKSRENDWDKLREIQKGKFPESENEEWFVSLSKDARSFIWAFWEGAASWEEEAKNAKKDLATAQAQLRRKDEAIAEALNAARLGYEEDLVLGGNDANHFKWTIELLQRLAALADGKEGGE